MKMIDPPKGWLFGFPKKLPSSVTDVNKWLVKNGYPQSLIDDLGEYFYVRVWEEPDKESKDNKID